MRLAEAGPVPFAAGLATLMESTPLPGQVAQVAAGIDPKLRSIAVRQAEAALDRKGPEFDLLEPPAAAGAALALAIRFDDLEGCGLLDLAARRRLHALRRGAEEACRDSFLASVERQVLAPLAALIEAPEVADETVAAIEAEARALARLECAGRRLGERRRAPMTARDAPSPRRFACSPAARSARAGLRPHGPGARRRDPVPEPRKPRRCSPDTAPAASPSPASSARLLRRHARGIGAARAVAVGGGAEGDQRPLRRRTPPSARRTRCAPPPTTRPSAESRVPIAACPVKRQSRSSVTARRTRLGSAQNSPAKAAAWSIMDSTTPPWTMPERLACGSAVSQTRRA